MPAFNEQAALPRALAEASAALEALCERWEIVVVDDGSTDDTPRLLAATARREPRIRVLVQRPNQGYGAALVRGFRSCAYAAIFYTDADGQFDLRELAVAYPLLAGADMVAGWRRVRRDPWRRRVASAVFNWLQSRLLRGVPLRDVDCAFKLFRRSFFQQVDLSSRGFLIDAELAARARRAGLRVVQLPVTHRPRLAGRSTVRPATVCRTLAQLWALTRALRGEERARPALARPG